MNRAVFLDRDGVVNELVYFPDAGIIDSPFTVDQFRLLPGVGEAVRRLNEAGFKVVVATNQPGVAKEHFTEATLLETHSRMLRGLEGQGAHLDGVYYCPHHPEGINSYRLDCDCRKPKPGLVNRAARELDIDLSASFMIGDSLTDVKAGQNAGCHTILIGRLKCDTCHLMDEQDVRPEAIAPDLLSAVEMILERADDSEGVRQTQKLSKSQPLFPESATLGSKSRKVSNYLFRSFPFDMTKLDYDEYWNKMSEENRPVSSFKLSLISGLVEDGSSVLDIGCGDGNLLQYLGREKGISGHGIDVSHKAVELARQRGIRAEVADISSETFQLGRTTDYIVASEVLEHLPNAERLMVKFKGKFKKSLIITIPNSGFLGERLRFLLGRSPKQWVLNPSEHLRFWTVTDFTFWCQQLGYRVESYYGLHDEFYDIKVKLWKYYPKLFSRYILYVVVQR